MYIQALKNQWLLYVPPSSSELILCKEIITIYIAIHTKHINTLCGKNAEFVNVKLVVHIVTTGIYRVNVHIKTQSVPRSKHTPSQLYKPVS
jgi:hypothetical protein